jgi:hypothetical protein
MNKSYKIAGLVCILLGIMVATQYVTGTTPEDLNNKPGKTPNAKPSGGHEGPIQIPKPVGPKDAPVKIKVYVTSSNSCGTSTVVGMEKVAKKFKDKVRVEYVDLLDKGGKAEAQKAKINCESGLSINGKSVMHLPGFGTNGLVMFDGPMEGGKNYGVKEVEAAVGSVLKDLAKKPKGTAKASAGA